MTGAWAGAGFGGRVLVAGLRIGQVFGVLLLLGFRVWGLGFGVGSTQPPHATQALLTVYNLNNQNLKTVYWFIIKVTIKAL